MIDEALLRIYDEDYNLIKETPLLGWALDPAGSDEGDEKYRYVFCNTTPLAGKGKKERKLEILFTLKELNAMVSRVKNLDHKLEMENSKKVPNPPLNESTLPWDTLVNPLGMSGILYKTIGDLYFITSVNEPVVTVDITDNESGLSARGNAFCWKDDEFNFTFGEALVTIRAMERLCSKIRRKIEKGNIIK